MAKEKQVLGKGLDVLFSQASSVLAETPGNVKKLPPEEIKNDSILFIEIAKIKTNPYQPREEFDAASLNELTESIKQKGVIQAITVRKVDGDHFELLSGERRMRAARSAGMDKIPAYIMDVSSKEDLLEISLVENIQRKDLNALEVAQGYQRLINECKLTQEQVAVKVGKSRSAITNFLRLLKLPEEIKQSIRKNEITEGHARAILSLETDAEQIHLWKRIIGENLSVRKTEEFTKKSRKKQEKKIFEVSNQYQSNINYLEEKFRQHFGTNVKLQPKSKTSGDIIIEYYTAEDLERIIELCKNK